MKLKKFLLHLFAILITPCFSQNIENIPISLGFENYSISQDSLGAIISSLDSDSFYKSGPSEFAIPYKIINILIGPSDSIISYSVSYEDSLICENINLASSPDVSPNNEQPKWDSYKKEYYDNNSFVKLISHHNIFGYRYVSFELTPFTYNPNNKKLYFNKNIVLDITKIQTQPQASNIVSMRYPKKIKDIVLNPNDIQELYLNNLDSINVSYEDSLNYSFDYIIITTEALRNAYYSLANWKNIKGVRTKILTIEDINNSFNGEIIPVKIKKILKQYWEKSKGRLQYVLLGGDIDLVPSLDVFVRVDSNAGTTTDITPCDFYYSSLNSIDWDSNQNGVFGEVEDLIDFSYDLYVSRIPTNNIYETIHFIDRIINYESHPNLVNQANKLLLCGSKIKTLSNGKSDVQIWGENTKHILSQIWEGDIFMSYDTFNDIGMSFTAYNLSSIFEMGEFSFYGIDTHGNESSWATANPNDPFLVTNAQYLNNMKNSLIITSACDTNAFDYNSDCLGEAFMKNINGTLAYIGSSRSNWSNPYGEPSETFNDNFFKILFSETRNIGKAFLDAKRKTFTAITHYFFAHRWVLFSMNMLGDPELPIYVSSPKVFHPDSFSISYNNNMLRVITKEENVKICITSLDDCGQSFFRIVESGNPIQIPHGNYRVCFTKKDYVPYTINLFDNLYIQNENITSNIENIAINTYIGKNVTPTKPQGDVHIINGKTIIYNLNKVEIKNNFQVQKGATFEIK